MSNPGALPFRRAIKRLYKIVSAMYNDSILILEGSEDLATDVVDRDEEADKLQWFIERQFNMMLEDSSLSRKLQASSFEGVVYSNVARYLERIADHACRFAEVGYVAGLIPGRKMLPLAKEASEILQLETAVAKFICKQIVSKAETEGKKIHTAYINCKQTNTPYGILTNIGKTYSNDWEDKVPNAGWRIDKVYSALKEKADEDGGIAIVILDEIDTLVSKSGDDILYHLTGLNSDLDNSKISLIGISNDTKFTSWLDPRVKSRMGEESLTFAPYNALQIENILVQRAKMAFHEGAVDPLVLSYCSSRAALEHGDARKALDLLRISAEIAEREGKEIVTVEYVSKAENVMEHDLVRSLISTLPLQPKVTLASIILNRGSKENGQQTTGEVYNTYSLICKRFEVEQLTQRRVGHIISELDMQGLINAKVVSLGRQGRTRYISLSIEQSQIDGALDNDSFLSRVIKEIKMSGYLSSMQLRLI